MDSKDLKDVKFFIGSVSKNVVDTIVDFSIKENYKIGMIPSRRQIDWDGGKVYQKGFDGNELVDYLKSILPNCIIVSNCIGVNLPTCCIT